MTARTLALLALLVYPVSAWTQVYTQPFRPQPARAQETVVSVSYPVADLVVSIDNLDRPLPARPQTPQSNPFNPTETPIVEDTKENWLIGKIMEIVAPDSWKDAGGRGTLSYSPRGMILEVTQTPRIQAQVKDLLTTMRRVQNVEVCIQTRVVGMSDAAFRKLRSIFPNLMKDGQAIISDIETFALLEKAQGMKDLNVMQAPKITVFPGQRAQLSITDTLDAKLCAMVAFNLRHIDLDVKANVSDVMFEKTARLLEGKTLVLPARSDDVTLLLLVTPRIIINLDESVTTPQHAQGIGLPRDGVPASGPRVIQAEAIAPMPAAPSSPAKSSEQTPIALTIRVCQGDPLGSVEANTLQILTQPQVATLPNQAFRVAVGNTIALPGGKTSDNIGVNLEGTPGNVVEGKLPLDLTVSLTSAGETSAERAVTHTARSRAVMTLKLGETTRFRFGAAGGEQQTWVEVTAREMHPQPSTSRQPEPAPVPQAVPAPNLRY